MRPAWSHQFAKDRLPPSTPLAFERPLTREWAWGGATGKGVRVAVVDSGIDTSHPQVGHVAGGVVVEQHDGEFRLVERPHDDLFGHGTACAGIIRRVAPECELYSVRVLGARLTGQGRAFIAGLRWAIDHHMHVINLSLGTSRREYFGELHELVDQAYFRGIALVSAVNNLPVESYPSQYAAVFSVAAHDGTDPFHFDYNPSPPAEFGAPGLDIEVPWLHGGTIRATGNSFAAAHISGLIARFLSRHPGARPFHVKTVLQALADNTVASSPDAGTEPRAASTPEQRPEQRPEPTSVATSGRVRADERAEAT